MKLKIIFVVLLAVIIARPLFIIFKNQNVFFKQTYHIRYQNLKTLYYGSQYMIKKNPGIIPDQDLEAFAGGAFLKGLNPILIVHDQPPLGRYITGLSILTFDNENTGIVFLFFTSLLGIFLISKKVLKNSLFALLPVAVFANEPLMLQKLTFTPLLEIIQLPFIIFAVYFFLKMVEGFQYSKKKKTTDMGNFYRWACVVSFFLGCVISIRFFVLGGALLFSFILFFVLKRRLKESICFASTLPIALLVLGISYTKTIQESGSFIKPFSVQKYILSYQSSKFIMPGTVWDLLVFNRWHTWWGERTISSDSNWILFWPLSLISTGLLACLALIKKLQLQDAELVLLLWVGCYLLMLSFGYSSTRYFLPLVPFLYILTCALLFRLNAVKRFFTK